jgi:hypothetical protein
VTLQFVRVEWQVRLRDVRATHLPGAFPRQVIGTAVIGGMPATTVVAIFLIPAMSSILYMVERFSTKKAIPAPRLIAN